MVENNRPRPLTPLEQAVANEINDPVRMQEIEKNWGLLTEEAQRNSKYFVEEVKPNPDYRGKLVIIVGQQVLGVIDPFLPPEEFRTAARQINQKILDGGATGKFTPIQIAVYSRPYFVP